MENKEIEELSSQIHDIYMKEADKQGNARNARRYEDLTENVKEYDRVLAKFILERERKPNNCNHSVEVNKKVGIERIDIAFMVQEIISEAHTRKKGVDMSDLIDKYAKKFASAQRQVPSVEEIVKCLDKFQASDLAVHSGTSKIAKAIHILLTEGAENG